MSCLSFQSSFYYISFQYSLIQFSHLILLNEDGSHIEFIDLILPKLSASVTESVIPFIPFSFTLLIVHSPTFLAFLLKSHLLTYVFYLVNMSFFQVLVFSPFSLYNPALVKFIYPPLPPPHDFHYIWMLLTLRITSISLIHTSS